MGRLPFDPDRMKSKPAPAPAGSPADQPLSVSDLAARVERAIASTFPERITVRGEVSGTRHRTHFYFNLKDERAVIGAVMFASAAKRADATPADGRVVIATGRLDYYAPQGRLSLVVDKLALDGQGSLDAQFRALCDELRELGWFDPASKRSLPVFPRRVAVVTSASSAALQDVLDTTRRRCPAVELVLIDATVQGARAAPALVKTLRDLSAAAPRLGIDAILLTRGGGSVEDLWCFNDRGLAQAIRECPIPTVAAIGHESDTTIAELVADRRAATPTQAAMLLTPDRDALAQQVDALRHRQSRALAARFTAERRHLAALANRPVLADPSQILSIQRDRLATLAKSLRSAALSALAARQRTAARLELALERRRPATEHARRLARIDAAETMLRDSMRHAMARRADRLARLEAVAHAIGPVAVLRRGFSITTTPGGTVLRSSLDARPGDRLTTRLHDGSLDSIVDGAPPNAPAPKSPASKSKPKRRPSTTPTDDHTSDHLAEPPPQLDLFAGSE